MSSIAAPMTDNNNKQQWSCKRHSIGICLHSETNP